MQVSNFDTTSSSQLRIPSNSLGKPFLATNLYLDQQFILARIVSKVREWLECDDLASFVPLRCTIVGQAGSGKSVLLNTITAVVRSMFGENNVLAVGCPTGTAAYNAFGETLHRLTKQGIRSEYVVNSMPDAKRDALIQRYKHLLCLIIDERSLLESRLLGTTARVISETIFHGCNADAMWGGLPVLILAGDDYQLPGMYEGAFEAAIRRGGSRMTQLGRRAFLECACTVFHLRTIRRVSDDKQADKDLLSRVRIGDDIRDDDLDRIKSLHLDTIRQLHGPAMVTQIESDAVYLFYTNEKRMQHNIQRLILTNSPERPSAIVQLLGSGQVGKGVKRHFDGDPPKAALICVGSVVCIQGFNFCPLWGLHNGACGIVREIIFQEGHSPNTGHHPEYVIVHFALYIGPPWDPASPKVLLNLTRDLD